jgi:hypothetical protein
MFSVFFTQAFYQYMPRPEPEPAIATGR